MEEILELSTRLAEQACDEIGVELLEIRYVPARTKGKLQLKIDREMSRVSVDDCVSVSRRLSRLLDVENVVSESYHLEVSSPGFDRKLRIPKDLSRFKGHKVRLELSEYLEGRKTWTGILLSTEDPLVLTADNFKLEIPLAKIIKANLND